MSEFYVKNGIVSYKLSNNKEIVDEYNKEKTEELEKNLDLMEDTINFKKKFKHYDFSFINLPVEQENIESEIRNTLIDLEKDYKDNMPDQIILGINKSSKYKDNWFIFKNGKNDTMINTISFKPFCARVDYDIKSSLVEVQYVLKEKGNVVKFNFKLHGDKSDEQYMDDVLKDYLK